MVGWDRGGGRPVGVLGMRGAERGDGRGWAWPMASCEGVMGGGVCKGLLREGTLKCWRTWSCIFVPLAL